MKTSFSDRISICQNKYFNIDKQPSQKQKQNAHKKIKIKSNNSNYKNTYIHRLISTQIQTKSTNQSILKKHTIQNHRKLKKTQIQPEIVKNSILKLEQFTQKKQNPPNSSQLVSKRTSQQFSNKKQNFQLQFLTSNENINFNDKLLRSSYILNKTNNSNIKFKQNSNKKLVNTTQINLIQLQQQLKQNQFQKKIQIVSKNSINLNKNNLNQTSKSQKKSIKSYESGINNLIDTIKKQKKQSQSKNPIKTNENPVKNNENPVKTNDNPVKNNENINLPYKRFNINKLDFSFDIKTINNDNEKQNKKLINNYCSIVQKSRNNITKIIQLNKLIKQRQNQKYQVFQEQSIKQNSVEILFKLKKGCFGTIYQGRLKQNGKHIAIKTIIQDKKYYQRQQQICKFINNSFLVKIHFIYTSLSQPIQKFQTKNISNIQKFNSYQNKHNINSNNHQFKKFIQNKPITKMTNIPIEQNKSIKSHFIIRDKKQYLNQITNLQDITLQSNQLLQKNNYNSNTNINNNQIKRNSKNNISILRNKSELQNLFANNSKFKQIQQNPATNRSTIVSPFKKIINIVMDLYDCDLHDYIQMKNKIDPLTLKLFSYQMVRSLLYLHSNQICHRDIKPHNFLVKKHIVVLSDFGSAKIMKNHKNSNVSYICSRYYRAPQLVLGYKYYDKSIDMWALGCTLAELALGKPIFPGVSSIDQLIKIIRILGQPNWRKISFMIQAIPKIPQIQAKGLRNTFDSQISSLFLDLLQNMLVFNPLHRISAGQALCHPYFDELREQSNFKQICKQMDIDHFLTFNRDELKKSQHLKNKLIPLWVSQSNNYRKSQSIQQFNDQMI